MARHWFLGGVSDWAFTTATADGVANLAQLTGGATIQFWNARVGGTRYTDLLDVNGDPIDEAVSSDGGDGSVVGAYAPIQGPDDVTYMWAGAGDGPRVLVATWDLGDLLSAVLAQVQSAEETANGLAADVATLKASTHVTLMYNGAGYPPKPAGFQLALRVGPTAPVAGVAEGDIWLQPEQT